MLSSDGMVGTSSRKEKSDSLSETACAARGLGNDDVEALFDLFRNRPRKRETAEGAVASVAGVPGSVITEEFVDIPALGVPGLEEIVEISVLFLISGKDIGGEVTTGEAGLEPSIGDSTFGFGDAGLD